MAGKGKKGSKKPESGNAEVKQNNETQVQKSDPSK
jgi:hypothetical protein